MNPEAKGVVMAAQGNLMTVQFEGVVE